MAITYTRDENRPRADTAGRTHRALHRLLFVAIVAMSLCIGALTLLRTIRGAQQQHDDPHVVTTWLAGVSYGPQPTLESGNTLVRWLNGRGIRIFGKTTTLTGRYSGDPGGLEIWFGYHSHVPGQPLLECHRVGRTAFTDDLGQEYHGYLDLQGDHIGVYLPGYDHAAHRLSLAVHWMPRAPAVPNPISRPMLFDIDLPRARRLLPPATSLPSRFVSQTQQGITVQAGDARLDPPKLAVNMGSQRDLIFHLKVSGGKPACSNMDNLDPRHGWSNRIQTYEPAIQAFRRALAAPWNAPKRPQSPLQITDPYGVPLLSTRERVEPMVSLNGTQCISDANGTVWIAPVNGAGKGTDVIRLHLTVQPDNPKLPLVPFDLTLPVQSDTEL